MCTTPATRPCSPGQLRQGSSCSPARLLHLWRWDGFLLVRLLTLPHAHTDVLSRNEERHQRQPAGVGALLLAESFPASALRVSRVHAQLLLHQGSPCYWGVLRGGLSHKLASSCILSLPYIDLQSWLLRTAARASLHSDHCPQECVFSMPSRGVGSLSLSFLRRQTCGSPQDSELFFFFFLFL